MTPKQKTREGRVAGLPEDFQSKSALPSFWELYAQADNCGVVRRHPGGRQPLFLRQGGASI